MIQTRNFQYMGIIHQAMHPHKHISKSLLMVNHNLQLHVEWFKFEGIIISYKWINGLLNVYMSDINSTIKRWQTTKVLETSHNFCQLFPFKPLYLISTHNIDYKFRHHHMDYWFANCKNFTMLEVSNSIRKFIKWTCNTDSYGNNKLITCVFLQQMFQLHSQLKNKLFINLECFIHLKSLY